MSSVAAEVGSTANNYQILAKLAVGGMAELFLARAETVGGLARYVVLKRILRHRASDSHFVEMFLEEARLASQLQHPNIAQVFDIGKLGDSYFFTMEYVHGDNVRALLHEAHRRGIEIPLGVILTVIAGAAAGLHHAHSRNGWDGRPLAIVHRDVTPSNLMVSFEGNVKVVDFGIAKAENRALETRSGMVKGKICYLSPEQCLGHPLDRRSDLFSLGIVLWELLTLERLYRHTSDYDNMMAIATSPIRPPSLIRHGLPAEIDELTMRLLAKHPHERYETAEQVLEQIETIAARTGTMLSTSALSRFMRELLGARPEPWLELEAASEPVTVRPEPIPADLTISPDESADLHLDRVRDLSRGRRVSARDHAEPAQPFVDNPPTVATQLLEIVSSPHPRHAATTVPAPAIGSVAPPWGSMVGPPPYAAPQGPPRPVPMPRPRRRWRIIPPIAVFVILAAIAAVITRVATKRPRAAPSQTVVARDPFAFAPAPDAALASAPDAALAAPIAAPIATQPLAPPIDEPFVDRPQAPTIAAPPDEPAIEPPARPRGSAATAIRRAYSAANYASVVEQCTKSVPVARARECFLAACQVDDAWRAKQWLALSPASKRSQLRAECRAAGLDLSPKPVAPKPQTKPVVSEQCLKDVLACPR
ncbi:MAG: protein kinase [Kofleriaceae bacterium]